MQIPDAEEVPTLTVDHAAAILGVSRATAYEAVKNGTIPSVRVSAGRIVVPTAALRRLLQMEATSVESES